jgi:hypothetical protein
MVLTAVVNNSLLPYATSADVDPRSLRNFNLDLIMVGLLNGGTVGPVVLLTVFGAGAYNHVASWYWKAGGLASINTDGSITSVVSANQAAGFSVVKV